MGSSFSSLNYLITYKAEPFNSHYPSVFIVCKYSDCILESSHFSNQHICTLCIRHVDPYASYWFEI